jgi:hypothetical protein
MSSFDGEQAIKTPYGLVKICDLKESMEVYTHGHGEESCKVHCVIDNGMQPCLKIKIFNGETLCCTPDALVSTQRGTVFAGDLKINDYLVIPVVYEPIKVKDVAIFKDGFIYGFALSDIHIREESDSVQMGFSASVNNRDRTEHVAALIKEFYRAKVSSCEGNYSPAKINGKDVYFTDTIYSWFSSKELKNGFQELFEKSILKSPDLDFKLGFLAGIISTDCYVSHHTGKYGVKHTIEISLVRKKYDKKWLLDKNRLVSALFNSLGISSTIRNQRIQINSLKSYNRVVEIFAPLVIGINRAKLFPVIPVRKISSYDCYLKDEYLDWFLSVKIRTTMLVKLNLASNYHRIRHKRLITSYYADTFKEHWPQLTDTPFLEPDKDYLLNKIISIDDIGMRHVFDLGIFGKQTLLTSACVVHTYDCKAETLSSRDLSKVKMSISKLFKIPSEGTVMVEA